MNLAMVDYSEYYKDVMKDIEETRIFYPWTKIIIPPVIHAQPIVLEVIAASKTLINDTAAGKEDFTGEYSRLLKGIIPYDYRSAGCQIYVPGWIDLTKIPLKYQHFNSKRMGTYNERLFCLGVPRSFRVLKNVILENIRTTEYMLSAYGLFMRGETEEVELRAYSHGEAGEEEYRLERKHNRYRNIKSNKKSTPRPYFP